MLQKHMEIQAILFNMYLNIFPFLVVTLIYFLFLSFRYFLDYFILVNRYLKIADLTD